MSDRLMVSWQWVKGRVFEPSTWAAASIVFIALSIALSISMLLWAACCTAAGALILKEKGNG